AAQPFGKALLVGAERQSKALPRSHDIADELGALGAGGAEPHRLLIAVEHAAKIDRIDRFGANLALARLDQALGEAAQAEALGIDAVHVSLILSASESRSLEHLDLAAVHDDGCPMQPSSARRQDEGGERGDIARKAEPRHVELAAISLDLGRHVETRFLHARFHL